MPLGPYDGPSVRRRGPVSVGGVERRARRTKGPSYGKLRSIQKPVFPSFLLWIDGVGARKLICGPSLIIGGPAASSKQQADLCLEAPLSRQHLSLQRRGEHLILDAHVETDCGGKALTGPHPLSFPTSPGQHLTLTMAKVATVRLRRPLPGNGTTVIEVTSSHRWQPRVDGVLWLERACVFGPGPFAHIECSLGGNARCVLFQEAGRLWFRPPEGMAWQLDDQEFTAPQPVTANATVECGDLRFRIEVA